MSLFAHAERRPFDIQQVAVPSDIVIFNCNWCEGRSYYADFCGIGFKYAPRRVLEIGVRYGYSGLAVCTGAVDAGVPDVEYTGVDAILLCQNSNDIAAAKFAQFCPTVKTRFFHRNTLLQGLPPELLGGPGKGKGKDVPPAQFDYILVDGDHSHAGAAADITACWPLLATGGLMLIDDLGMVDVKRAVDEHRDTMVAAGEVFQYQQHHNERILAIFRKGA